MRVLPWARTHAAKLSSCGMGRFCLSFLSLADSFGVAATHSTTCPLMHLSVLACSCSQTCISVRVCVWGGGERESISGGTRYVDITNTVAILVYACALRPLSEDRVGPSVKGFGGSALREVWGASVVHCSGFPLMKLQVILAFREASRGQGESGWCSD